jgi:hypothetical protein
VGGRLLLDPSLTLGFEERLFVDHEEGVTSVTSSFTSDSPEARKDRPGCGSSVDGNEDEVAVDGGVEDVQWVKKLSQCLAVLERLTCRKPNKLCNNLQIIYIILGYLGFQTSPILCDLD